MCIRIRGINPATPDTLAWTSECITLVAQALATIEILEIALRPYQGIWGLGWRALTVTSGTVVLLVVLAARGHWAWARWFELDRGYHLTFATALIACLLLVRYYSIPVPPAYKMLLGGFCFYSCSEIIVNTLLQAYFKEDFFLHAGRMATFDHVLLYSQPSCLGGRPLEAFARRRS